MHSSDYMFQRKRLLSLSSITVIGSGQSAAEIFYDLLQERNWFKEGLSWFTKSERFYPMEYSKLTLEMSTPEYIDFFFSLEKEKRKNLLNQQDILYKGINFNLINQIYELLYQQWVEEISTPIRIQTNSELTNICHNHKTLRCTFNHILRDKPFDHQTEAVILATGYKSISPSFLKPLINHILVNNDRTYNAKRNYSIDAENRIFIQNGEYSTHGFNAADLGLDPYRNATIINQITGNKRFNYETHDCFQSY